MFMSSFQQTHALLLMVVQTPRRVTSRTVQYSILLLRGDHCVGDLSLCTLFMGEGRKLRKTIVHCINL